MKEFKVNDFITLKLEEGRIDIYVKERIVFQKMFLLLNIPVKNNEKSENIESIDQVADILGWKKWGQVSINVYEKEMDPETVFWGYCSNLQVWAENNYDTRLLHSSLSFNLLTKLVEAGDPVAKKVFKNEVVSRFESGYPTTIKYICETQIILYALTPFEREKLLERTFPKFLDNIHNITEFEEIITILLKIKTFKEGKLIIQNYYPDFLRVISKFPAYDRFCAFFRIINLVKVSRILRNHYSLFENHVLEYLEGIEEIKEDRRYLYINSIDLIDSIKETKLFRDHFSRIESLFFSILNEFGQIAYPGDVYLDILDEDSNRQLELERNILSHTIGSDAKTFFALIKVAKRTGFINHKFSAFLKALTRLSDFKARALYRLLEGYQVNTLTDENLLEIERIFLSILEDLDNRSDDHEPRSKYKAFGNLIDAIKDTELLQKHHSLIETKFAALLDHIQDIQIYYLHEDQVKFQAFIRLFRVSILMGLIGKYYIKFLELVEIIYKDYKNRVFFKLIETESVSDLVKKHYPLLLKTIAKLPKKERYRAFQKLIEVVNLKTLDEKTISVQWEEIKSNVEEYLNHNLPISDIDDKTKFMIINRLFEKNNFNLIEDFTDLLVEKKDVLFKVQKGEYMLQNGVYYKTKYLELFFKGIERKKSSKFVFGLLEKGYLFSLNQSDIEQFFKLVIKLINRTSYFLHVDQSILKKHKNFIRKEIIKYLKKLSKSELEEILIQFNLIKFIEEPVSKENDKINIFYFLDETDFEYTPKMKKSNIQKFRTLRFQNIPDEKLAKIRQIESNIYSFLTDEIYRKNLNDHDLKLLASKFDFHTKYDLYHLVDRHRDLELKFGIGEYLSELIRCGDDKFLYSVIEYELMELLDAEQVNDLLNNPDLRLFGRILSIIDKNYDKFHYNVGHYFYPDLLKKGKPAIFESIVRMFKNDDVELINLLFHNELFYELLDSKKSKSSLQKLVDDPDLNFLEKGLEAIDFAPRIIVDVDNYSNIIEKFISTLKDLSNDILDTYVDNVFIKNIPEEVFNIIKVGMLKYIASEKIESYFTDSAFNVFDHLVDYFKTTKDGYDDEEIINFVKELPKRYLQEMVIECFEQGEPAVISLIFDSFYEIYDKIIDVQYLKKLKPALISKIFQGLISIYNFSGSVEFEGREYREEGLEYYFESIKRDEKLFDILQKAILDSFKGEPSLIFKDYSSSITARLTYFTELLDNLNSKQLLIKHENIICRNIAKLTNAKYLDFEYLLYYVSDLSKILDENLWLKIAKLMTVDEKDSLLKEIIKLRDLSDPLYTDIKSLINLISEGTTNVIHWVNYHEKDYLVFNHELELSHEENLDFNAFQPQNILSNLKKLTMYSCLSLNLDSFRCLRDLEELKIIQSNLTTMDGVGFCSNLKKLDLSVNKISKISGINSLSNLEEIDLHSNRIEEIEGLESLKSLKIIDLRSNKITEIKGLEKLKNLKKLYIYSNPISDGKDRKEKREMKNSFQFVSFKKYGY